MSGFHIKKYLPIILILLFWISSDVHATKARLTALGQDAENASHYIEDDRSIFRNSAYLNIIKNYLVMEWGDPTPDFSNNKPNAEGGVFSEVGDFVLGVYLGSEHRSFNETKSDGGIIGHDNRIDLFFAGDAGIKWGIRLYYADGKDQTTKTFQKDHTAMGLGFGAIGDRLTLYVNMDLEDEAKGGNHAGDKWEAELGVNFGASYLLGEGIAVFGEYDQREYKTIMNSVSLGYEERKYLMGIGKIYELSNTSRLFGDLEFSYHDIELNKTIAVPLTFGVEARIYEWLTFRGSLEQQIYKMTELKRRKKSSDDSTMVRAGATLSFDKLRIDGLIGTTGRSRSANNNPEDPEGVLATDNMMTSVSVRYLF